jgi:hypothetical protein
MMEELGLLLEVAIGPLPFGRLRLEKCFTSCLGTRGLSRGWIYILGTLGRQAAFQLYPSRQAGFCLCCCHWASRCVRPKDDADKQRTYHPHRIKRYEFTIGRIGRSGFLIDVNTKLAACMRLLYISCDLCPPVLMLLCYLH